MKIEVEFFIKMNVTAIGRRTEYILIKNNQQYQTTSIADL